MQSRRQRWQLRLRTLMLLVAVLAVGLAVACYAHRANQRQWAALAEIQAAAVPFKASEHLDGESRDLLAIDQPYVKSAWSPYRPLGLSFGSLGRHYVSISELEVKGDAPVWVVLHHLDDLPDLVELSIDGDTASDEWLVRLGRLKHLKRIRIRSSSMNGSFLESIPDKANLVRLDLSSPAIEEQAVAQICRCENLEVLRISNVRIKNPSSLRQLSKLRHLTHIYLSGELPNEGLEALAELPSHEDVTLACNWLNNDGVSRVAASRSVSFLKLYSWEGVVDDEIVDELAAMPELLTVYLHNTKVTPAGVEKLRQLRPDVGVDAIYPR